MSEIVVGSHLDLNNNEIRNAGDVSLGTLTEGEWQAGVIAGAYGGTGVANSGKTITLGGDLTTSGAFGTTLTVTGTTSVTLPTSGTLMALDTTATQTGTKTFSGSLVIDSTTDASSTTTGSIQTDGGVGIAKALRVGTDIYAGSSAIVGNVMGDSVAVLTTGIDIVSITPTVKILQLGLTNITASHASLTLTAGSLTVGSTTDSSSSTTGSLKTAGGAGIAKALYVGTTLNVSGASAFSGALSITDATDSSSTSTGALKVSGGLGVVKKISTGDDVNVGGALNLGSLTGDRLMLYGAKDVASSYGLGIESGTLYYRANSTHRWYTSTLADGGTSDRMELNVNGLYPNYLNLANTADTPTAATHYYVETATDGFVRPKTLANVKAEIVTTAAVNSAAATTVGTLGSLTVSGSFNIGASSALPSLGAELGSGSGMTQTVTTVIGTYYYVTATTLTACTISPAGAAGETSLNVQANRTAFIATAVSHTLTGTGTGFLSVKAITNSATAGMFVGQHVRTSAAANLGLGSLALAKNFTNYTVAIGEQALQSNVTGYGNVAFGYYALGTNVTGTYNTGIGYNALGSMNTGDWNTALGRSAAAYNVSGSGNTTIGYYAGTYQTGSYNLAMGFQSGLGSSGTTTGSYNTFVGGISAGRSFTSGSYNLMLGSNVGYTGSTGTVSGSVAIGTNSSGTGAQVTADNTIVLGTSAHSTQIPGAASITGNLTLSGTLNVTGATTLTGNVISNVSIVKSGAAFQIYGTSGASTIYLDRTAGNSGQIQFRTGQSASGLRWTILANSAAESGSNAGSDFAIQRLTDAGGFIDNALTIIRQTGSAYFSGNVTASGDLTVSKNGGAINMTAATGNALNFRLQTSGTNRWSFLKTSEAESGSNAGSNFQLYKYTDGGSGSVNLDINRSTGKWTFRDVGSSAGLELGTSGPRVMSGTGSPEGVVTAPVGSRWIRTDGDTLGDFEYQKRSGTGNTGWVVADGDTGWRSVTTSMEAAFAASNPNATLYVRRVNDKVTYMLNETVAGSGTGTVTIYLPPAGFRETVGSRPVGDDCINANTGGGTNETLYLNSNTLLGFAWTAIRHQAILTFPVGSATPWPTSLPGSAA